MVSYIAQMTAIENILHGIWTQNCPLNRVVMFVAFILAFYANLITSSRLGDKGSHFITGKKGKTNKTEN